MPFESSQQEIAFRFQKESAKSKERLDLATELVSFLLSRIRQQPDSSQGLDWTEFRA
ncbi:hypothetical protein Pint_33135 [Pistacia integerrima]|uniref:Uncharacterized protein n=1 Tax=Pistacia integerrima TaxID=434235 RepID=A0ACC0X846_9ROSI|nr:hypothetical protein Pint_33135 [Pistacia integerrima]